MSYTWWRLLIFHTGMWSLPSTFILIKYTSAVFISVPPSTAFGFWLFTAGENMMRGLKRGRHPSVSHTHTHTHTRTYTHTHTPVNIVTCFAVHVTSYRLGQPPAIWILSCRAVKRYTCCGSGPVTSSSWHDFYCGPRRNLKLEHIYLTLFV